eukprot:TRINITY_DN49591_c0_g1_i2.p1 TRINITY_DN49591_c0_g1~~TRINITY_DN49591_c0_g1_i2.p1  ORF type:complete len:533 (-),score=129.55 TRINITY_DN49591_c0_g1_i2:403-2001(-)
MAGVSQLEFMPLKQNMRLSARPERDPFQFLEEIDAKHMGIFDDHKETAQIHRDLWNQFSVQQARDQVEFQKAVLEACGQGTEADAAVIVRPEGQRKGGRAKLPGFMKVREGSDVKESRVSANAPLMPRFRISAFAKSSMPQGGSAKPRITGSSAATSSRTPCVVAEPEGTPASQWERDDDDHSREVRREQGRVHVASKTAPHIALSGLQSRQLAAEKPLRDKIRHAARQEQRQTLLREMEEDPRLELDVQETAAARARRQEQSGRESDALNLKHSQAPSFEASLENSVLSQKRQSAGEEREQHRKDSRSPDRRSRRPLRCRLAPRAASARGADRPHGRCDSSAYPSLQKRQRSPSRRRSDGMHSETPAGNAESNQLPTNSKAKLMAAFEGKRMLESAGDLLAELKGLKAGKQSKPIRGKQAKKKDKKSVKKKEKKKGTKSSSPSSSSDSSSCSGSRSSGKKGKAKKKTKKKQKKAAKKKKTQPADGEAAITCFSSVSVSSAEASDAEQGLGQDEDDGIPCFIFGEPPEGLPE